MNAEPAARETRIAPNIYKTPYGHRVYVRRRDPKTGKSVKRPKRFGPEFTLEELEHFRDSYKLESKKLRREARETKRAAAVQLVGTFTEDAKSYLDLPTTKAMPSYAGRKRDIDRWATLFRKRLRRSITTRDIDQQLQRWIDEGCAASTVNGRRTALMALFTRLDGRAAANPVRESKLYEEPEEQPRGLPYPIVVQILDAIPATRSFSYLRDDTKTRPVKTRIRLEVMAWTGMRPSQVMRLTKEHFSIKDRWFVTPRSAKGRRRGRHPRPVIRKPLTADAAAALQRFVDCDCWGTFSTSSARRLFVRALREVEKVIRKQRRNRTFSLAGVRPYDLRHSFATEVFRRTKNLRLVQELLDHSSSRTTTRYSIGAMSEVLTSAARAFEAGTTRGRRRIDTTAKRPAPPKPRGTRSGGTTQRLTR